MSTVRDGIEAAGIREASSTTTLDYRAPRGRGRKRLTTTDLTHSGMTLGRFVSMHVQGVLFPITAGLMLYGWRAFGSLVLVCGSALAAAFVWRQVGRRGLRVHYGEVLWLAVLLALTLPAHLFTTGDPSRMSWQTSVVHSPSDERGYAAWPLLVATGVALTIILWLLAGAGSGRLHPVLIVHLLIFVIFGDLLVPQLTLKRQHAFWGDVLDVPAPSSQQPRSALEPQPEASKQAWITSERDYSPFEAIRSDPAALRLEKFTGGYEAPERNWISLESLVRDRLPPLEDLIVGGQPAPIGQGSAIAVIIGGLFLLYRGLIDYRVPLIIVLTAFISFLVLPVPAVITEKAKIFRWIVMHETGVGPALGVTFANYELMASPLMFTAFFLATSTFVRPLARRARVIYAFLLGVSAAAFQLYVSVVIGPYLALLSISLLTPALDRVFKPDTLV
jgi:Na+-translocating ferredoxin:NAD+ oxidoreductase RnfD subunit